MKELVHAFALDENDNLIKADLVTVEDNLKHNYHIIGIDKDTGERITEKVLFVNSTKKRKHFRRYAKGSPNRNNNFVFKQREYNELLLHRLAKEMIADGRIKRLLLPGIQHSIGDNKIRVLKENVFGIEKAQVECRKTLPTGEYVIYDVFVTNNSGEELAVEIYTTHSVDSEKIDKVMKLGHNLIEINLRSLLDDSNNEKDLESRIAEYIEKHNNTAIIWLNNNSNNRFAEWLNGQIEFPITKTEHDRDRDGEWYLWATDKFDEISKCPFIHNLDKDSRNPKHRQIVASQCLSCPRLSIKDVPIRLRVPGKN